MNISDTKANMRLSPQNLRRQASSLLMALLVGLMGVNQAAAKEDSHRLVGEATLGVQFYDLDSPYDTSNVAGFFEQYRYIRDQGATLPFFLDLVHLNAGVMREDDTYLLQVERWSRNALNSNGFLDVNWRGLDLSFDYRRYRSDSLRFFPKGTWGGEPSPPESFGVQYNSDLCPSNSVPPNPCTASAFGLQSSDVFDNNNRIFVNRQSVGGDLALRPEGFNHDLPVLKELRTRARYETRKGYRQDSFVLAVPQENASSTLTQGFRGNRRKINQSVTSAGTTFVLSPFNLFESSLAFDFEKFREEAPIVTLNSLSVPTAAPDPPGEQRAFFFVPDTNRYTGTLQLSKRTQSGVFNAGVSAARLEQTGRQSPLEQYYGLCDGRGSTCDNAITLVSAHLDASVPLPGNSKLNTWMKYTYRDSDRARQDFLTEAFFKFPQPREAGFPNYQESPYIQERNQVRGGLELAASPVRGSQIATGYRFDWVNRNLVFQSEPSLPFDFPLGVQPAVSLIKPKSFESEIYLRFRMRLFRSLQFSGRLAGSWASEVAYPNDLSEAFRLRLRANYSLAQHFSLPITLSLTGQVLDGQNDEFPIPNSDPDLNRNNQFEQTTWGYDISLTGVPTQSWVLFATFAQNVNEQSFGYIRTDYPRYLDGFIPISFYIDSFPHYKSNVKSLTFGTSLGAWERLETELAVSLTWVDVGARGEAGVGSNVGQLIDQANRIQDRILTLNSEISYRFNEHVGVGAGYRFQQFINGVQLDPIDLNETVHTISAQVSVNFAGFSASLKNEN